MKEQQVCRQLPRTFRCSRARNRHWEAYWEAAARHFKRPIRESVGAAANARRISGFKSNRSILLPLRNRLNRLGPETLCHQQPVVCEIAGEKRPKRSIFRR